MHLQPVLFPKNSLPLCGQRSPQIKELANSAELRTTCKPGLQAQSPSAAPTGLVPNLKVLKFNCPGDEDDDQVVVKDQPGFFTERNNRPDT